MITVEEALEKVLSYVGVLGREEKPILECLGQVLDEDIYSPIDVPPLANSAMDGFAVRWNSTQGASKDSPRVLRVTGEVAAGRVTEQEVQPGTAIRIMTGAPIPEGADSVVPFEDTDEAERKAPGKTISEIGILCEVSKGSNLREAGEDITAGALVLKKGTVLHPPQIGVLASLGRGRVVVIRRPVVAVLATGDELVDVDLPLPKGKIYNSNTYSLAAQVKRYGGIPKILGSAPDSAEMLTDKIRQGLDSDMLITSGGVSRGDYDMVKDVLAKEGEVAFWTVRMKPGKPLAFGVLGEKRVPHLGLPGNPVSVMITFDLFARPAILKMMGKTNLARPTIEAVLENPIENSDSRRLFVRSVVTRRDDRYFAHLTGPQGSGILTSMAQANGLVIIPESVPRVKEGDLVQVLMLDWDEDR
jgi:molybdopterin molybdotransferase